MEEKKINYTFIEKLVLENGSDYDLGRKIRRTFWKIRNKGKNTIND